MNFEDTKLPDTPETRTAFEKATFESQLVSMSNPHLTDDGLSPGSLKLLTRCAQVLQETTPGASPVQLASAMVFLTYGFSQPVLMERGGAPAEITAWSKEWRQVNTGQIPLRNASLELRQTIVAVNTAMLEGMKANFPQLKNLIGVDQQVAQSDMMLMQCGDIQSPALVTKYNQLSQEMKDMIDAAAPPSPTSGYRKLPPKF